MSRVILYNAEFMANIFFETHILCSLNSAYSDYTAAKRHNYCVNFKMRYAFTDSQVT